ncbi:S-adenosyl-L-methionine-dependent methyltransferase [Rhypophila sp. PSN 637]
MSTHSITADQADISIGSTPCDIDNVPTLLKSISSFRGRDDLGTNRDDRLNLLEQARQLVHALETPRELMLKHIGAETASFFSIALGVDVGLFKALVLHQGRPKKVKEIAGIIGFDVDGMSRILRHLAAMGHIENTGPDEYAPNNFSKALTIPVIADGYLFYRETCIPSMLHLHSWLKTKAYQTRTTVIDNPFTFGQRTSMTMFEFIAIEPHRMEHFNYHMGGYRLGRPSWFEPSVYPAQERLLVPDSSNSDAAVLVDIGGNKGHDLERLLSYFPSVAKSENKGKFILQDTAPVLAEAPSDLNSLIEKQPHDFFTPQPVQGAKAYYLHHILHDWPDAKCEVIVNQIRRSMKKGYSRLLINEHVIPPVGANWEATHLDLYMMVQFGSRERTEECGMRIVGIWNPGNGFEAVIECEI